MGDEALTYGRSTVMSKSSAIASGRDWPAGKAKGIPVSALRSLGWT